MKRNSNNVGYCIRLLVLLVACFWLSNCANSTDTSTDKQGVSPKAETPLAGREEASALVAKMLEEPLPPQYEVPAYITSGLPIGMVYDTLAKRYPDFYGFTDTQLLDSIVQHPNRFWLMATENKAIRRYYDPHSKY